MTYNELAEIYARCFPNDRHLWQAEGIRALDLSAHGGVVQSENGAAFLQFAADEGEILSLFIAPEKQGGGEGFRLLQEVMAWFSIRSLQKIFLEVAVDNVPAIGLYQKYGFERCGIRQNYYHRRSGEVVDAILMVFTF